MIDPTQSLVAKAQNGDRAAFDEIVARHAGQLMAVIRSRIGSHLRPKLDPEDVLQDTLLGAFQSISHFTWRDEPGFLRWLQSIAENRIRDAAKGPKAADEFELPADARADGVSPSRHVQRSERFDRLQSSLDRLSPDHRTVVMLSRIDGLKIKEIAHRMNRSESAVKNLLLRALRELKSSFGDTESLHLPDGRLDSRSSNRGENESF